MESDLISRQAAIDALMEILDEPSHAEFLYTDEIYKALNGLPSAQPEQTKGKWIHDGYDFPHGIDWIHCSICGKKGINVPADLTNFCPNCGADMRDQEGEE